MITEPGTSPNNCLENSPEIENHDTNHSDPLTPLTSREPESQVLLHDHCGVRTVKPVRTEIFRAENLQLRGDELAEQAEPTERPIVTAETTPITAELTEPSPVTANIA